jgi:putative ABC transport system permease protein
MNRPTDSVSAVDRGRDGWMVRVVGGILRDLQLAARQLRKSRGFTTVTLLTLALCIGANTAIFSMVYALLLKPLPFPEPSRLVGVYNDFPKPGLNRLPSSIQQYLDFQQHTSSYSALGLWVQYQGMFGEETSAHPLTVGRATRGFFEALGVKPLIGQFFTDDQQRSGADKVAVLTQSFWETQFAEDPSILGKTLRFDGESYTIIGVAPRALEAFDARVRFVWPVSWDAATLNPGGRYRLGYALVARLRPGVPMGQAHAEAELIEQRYYDGAAPEERKFINDTGHKIDVALLQMERVQPLRSTLYLLEAGVVLVLLIGCVNVANLLLARANGRQGELAIRLALGASRGLIARQLLVESALLTVLGGALGVGVAFGAIRGVNHFIAGLMPNLLPFAIDLRVLGFTVAISVAAGLFVGLVPVVHVLRANLMALIHGQSRSTSGSLGVRTLSSVLIVGQVAVALMLLAGAALLVRSFVNVLAVPSGIDPQHVVTGRVSVPAAHRKTEEAERALQDRMVQALQDIPGASAVALGVATPFRGALPVNALNFEENALPPGSTQPSAFRVMVTPGYLATLKLTLIEGRFFTADDMIKGRPPAFVVDEAFAKKYFPGRSALGGRFTFGNRPAKDSDWPTIVGVVRNVPHNGVEDDRGVPFIYHLFGGRPGALTVFVRSDRAANETLTAMQDTLRRVDPALTMYDTGPLQTFVDASFDNRRAVMLLLGTFAGLALFLSALGIYGMLAYDVSQRTREIGIRGALGATREQVIGLVMRQGVAKTLIGVVLGLVGALSLSHAMTTLLFQVKPTDPVGYVAVSCVLIAVGAVASYLPARRAAKIDPIRALRVE